MPKKKKLTQAQLGARAKGQVASRKLAAAASKNDAEDEGREGGRAGPPLLWDRPGPSPA